MLYRGDLKEKILSLKKYSKIQRDIGITRFVYLVGICYQSKPSFKSELEYIGG